MISRLERFFLAATILPFITFIHACETAPSSPGGLVLPDGVVAKKVEVLKIYPHDQDAYTQGLIWENGWIYESTGRNGKSGIRVYKPGDPPGLPRVSLDRNYFGEGIAKIGGRIFMLTWRSGKAFVFETGQFRKSGEFAYQGEGWGLCHDGRWLIMSDGSDTLSYRDPVSFEEWKTVPVRLGDEPVYYLNELEFARGRIYANVWQQDYLVEIDPSTGMVTALVDASSLPYQSRIPGEDVLNGIAYVQERDSFLLTGKLWPEIYEVRFVPAD